MTEEGGDARQKAEVERQLKLLLHGVVDCEKREELEKRLARSLQQGKPLRVKLGLDPTSPDLHLGHSVVLRKLRQFQDLGHHAIFIVGGATAMLGDPSGRDKTRPQLTREQVDANAKTYLDQAFKVVRREEAHGSIEIVNNADWFEKQGFADFIRLCSKSTVARMIERDNFAKRMKEGSPISIHELVYPLMQGHDSVEVRADVELGGTDQLFNLLVGRDLQAGAGQAPQVCMTTAILTGLDGRQKMSKSLGNYVGLSFSADEVFGKTMSLPDALMKSWYTLLTSTSDQEVDARIAKDPREAKAALAAALAAELHGEAAGRAARERFDRLFRDKLVPDEMARVVIPAAELTDGRLWIVKLLVAAGFAATNGEARRLLEGRGVRLDGEVVADEKLQVELSGERLLQAGKRRFARVVRGD
jgi:tyrosyl-tRNA synthetase